MKQTAFVIALLILTAWVWGGCKKSENNTPTQTKNSTITHMSGGVTTVKTKDSNNTVIHDSTPVLPAPIYFTGNSYIQNWLDGTWADTIVTETVVMYWTSIDTVVFEAKRYFGLSGSNPNYMDNTICTFHSDTIILNDHHRPTIFISEKHHDYKKFTLYNNDSLNLYWSTSGPCFYSYSKYFHGMPH